MHLFIFIFIVVAFITALYSFEYFFFLGPFSSVSILDGYSLGVGNTLVFKNEYFLSYIVPIFVSFKGTLVDILYLEKSLFFNSKLFFVKPDIFNFFFFDLYCIIGPGNVENG